MSQQYKVPQNIDLEDKVVGPFTMKQFGYLMGGGLIIYALYQTLASYQNGILYTVIIGIPIAALALALTFIKINDRPFEYFIANLAQFAFAPKKRIWQRGYSVPMLVITTPVKQKASTSTEAQKQAALDDIARQLEYSAGNMGPSTPTTSQQGTAPASGAGQQPQGQTSPGVQGITQPPAPGVQGVTPPSNIQVPQKQGFFG